MKIASKKNEILLGLKDANKKRHENEVKLNEAKAEAIAKKLSKLRLDAAAQAAEAAEEAIAAAEEPAAEATETAPEE